MRILYLAPKLRGASRLKILHVPSFPNKLLPSVYLLEYLLLIIILRY